MKYKFHVRDQSYGRDRNSLTICLFGHATPIDIQVWTMYRYDLPLRSDCDDIIHINTSISRPLSEWNRVFDDMRFR